jgi:oligopeptide/dipeptide ABC transporter ATP-binding protein
MAAAPSPVRESAPGDAPALLDVRELSAAFFTRRGAVHAVDRVSFALRPGETLGLVGESGCGKTATAMSLLRMLPFPGRVTGGEIVFEGQDLLGTPEPAMARIRGRRIAMIPQDPTSALNPLMRIGDHLVEVLQVHLGLGGAAARARAIELLAMVGIPEAERRFKAYPFQLSGGMRQRVMIAMALSCGPSLLIADEPTTALDATVQAQILELIQSLGRETNTATILITHNLGIVAGLCDRVAVMYAGRIVETATRDELFARPRHPYTLGLLRCVPRLDRVGVADLQSIPGRPPDLITLPWGCAFAPRCPYATNVCNEDVPPLDSAGDEGHLAACWHKERVAAEAGR